jgi:hypothetical protein
MMKFLEFSKVINYPQYPDGIRSHDPYAPFSSEAGVDNTNIYVEQNN